jgi:AcrR family transcriptional regulator
MVLHVNDDLPVDSAAAAARATGEPSPRERVLDAAESLFYARGVQAVCMDAIRDAAGVPLKRLYALFPSKQQLLTAVLERRDVRWRGRLAAHVELVSDPRERLLAVFDWLAAWFAEPGFRGCAWINLHGELGATDEAIADLARRHKTAFRDYIAGLAAAAGLPRPTADAVFLLAEGAIVTAGITRSPEAAGQAQAAVGTLIDVVGKTGDSIGGHAAKRRQD